MEDYTAKLSLLESQIHDLLKERHSPDSFEFIRSATSVVRTIGILADSISLKERTSCDPFALMILAACLGKSDLFKNSFYKLRLNCDDEMPSKQDIFSTLSGAGSACLVSELRDFLDSQLT